MRRRVLLLAGLPALASCAGPPLTIYTLALPPATGPDPQLGRKPVVIAVSRITLQSDVDGTDIILRDGTVLRRSLTGRWGTRLSTGIAQRLADRLAERYTQALVTTSPLTDAPDVTLRINVSRLDIAADGTAVLEADWLVIPRNPRLPERQQRTRIVLQAPVATDADVVAVTGTLTDRLAEAVAQGIVREAARS